MRRESEICNATAILQVSGKLNLLMNLNRVTLIVLGFLLGLSKGNARVEISASFFFFRSATVCNSLINTHARRFY